MAYLLDAVRINTTALIEEILDVDYLLLAYKKELARAQPPVNHSLVLNFLPTKKIRGGFDVEPCMGMFVIGREEKWMLRRLDFKAGDLHLARPFGKGGMPLEQDNIVTALLKEIDVLLQARAKLIELSRSLRQFTSGTIAHSEKIRSLASDKIDKLSPRITIDWTKPNAGTQAALKRQAAREDRALRKQTKNQKLKDHL